jgi:DHA3 family macrolide efflux protein-like MFS transporter
VISVDVITAIIAVTPLLFIRIPQPIRTDGGVMLTPKVVLNDVVEGFKYMRNWKGLLYLAFLAAMLNFLLAPAGTLSPLMVTQHFKAGVWELSMIESSMGIGVVIGGIVLGVWGGFKNRILTSLTGIVGIGLGVVIFGVAPANMFWLGLVGMVIMGFMNPIANGPLQAIMQSKVAPEMQGRVMGTTSALCSAMMPLSMVIVAPVAELLGLRVWYWVGGGLTILIGLGAFYIPSIMALDSSIKDISTAQIAAD